MTAPRTLLALCTALFAAPLLHAQSAPAPVRISLAHDSAGEKSTKVQLERLLATYDLQPWLFTRTVVIDQTAIPGSHPVLTLHTRHLKDDDLLLSTFVHEELHWWVSDHTEKADAAAADIRKLYPKIPVGYPQGSNDEHGNDIHMIVIPLEWRADRLLMGELRARQVMEFWTNDHYTWLYRTVLEHMGEIGSIVRKHRLFPDEVKNAER